MVWTLLSDISEDERIKRKILKKKMKVELKERKKDRKRGTQRRWKYNEKKEKDARKR